LVISIELFIRLPVLASSAHKKFFNSVDRSPNTDQRATGSLIERDMKEVKPLLAIIASRGEKSVILERTDPIETLVATKNEKVTAK